MNIHFIPKSSNRKTGAIPTTYSDRKTCPPSCPHYEDDCYGEDYYTRLNWNKVPERGQSLAETCKKIAALPDLELWRMNIAGDLPGLAETIDAAALGEIVLANIGKRGFTYTHKKSPEAIYWIRHAVQWGFTINLSADDAGEADTLAATGLPTVCIVPFDTPDHSTTPEGRPIKICPNQINDDITCKICQLCQKADRKAIVGFRAHGSKSKKTDALARRVIPIMKAN
jgi:hypothetical protein